MLSLLSLASESIPGQFNFFELLQVTGTPGTMLLLYIVWWRTVGKEKAEKDAQTAVALQRAGITLGEVASNLYRLHDKAEDLHENTTREAERLVQRGERIADRLDERFPSGAIHPPKPIGD